MANQHGILELLVELARRQRARDDGPTVRDDYRGSAPWPSPRAREWVDPRFPEGSDQLRASSVMDDILEEERRRRAADLLMRMQRAMPSMQPWNANQATENLANTARGHDWAGRGLDYGPVTEEDLLADIKSPGSHPPIPRAREPRF